jgi:DNA-binding MarR family transcriptional regulator
VWDNPDMTWIPQNTAGHLINRAARLLTRLADARLKALGVAGGQIPVLAALQGGSERSQASLVQLARVEQPTMAATLARMERDGLIRRRPDPDDGRGSLISLTPEAMAKLPGVRRALSGLGREVLEGFGECEKEILVGLTQRMISNLERIVDRDAV